MCVIKVNGTEIPIGKYPTLQRNMTVTRDFTHVIPKPPMVVVHINEHPAHAFIDIGFLGDFMSITLAKQLKIKQLQLKKPLTFSLQSKICDQK